MSALPRRHRPGRVVLVLRLDGAGERERVEECACCDAWRLVGRWLWHGSLFCKAR